MQLVERRWWLAERIAMKRMRKPQRATEAITALTVALHRRHLSGVQVVNIADHVLPDAPTVDVVPYLHYGAIGLNALEGYDSIIFVHGYYIPDAMLAEAVFPHLPPSQRPVPRISTHGGRRRVTWTGTISVEDQRLAEVFLFRLEADPALQAFGRVRFTVSPRTVVMSIQHHLPSRLGRVTTVPTLTAARVALGLRSTTDERFQREIQHLQPLLAQGQTLTAAAQSLDIAPRTAKRLAATAGLSLRKGRRGGADPGESLEMVPNSLYSLYKVGLAPLPDHGHLPSPSLEPIIITGKAVWTA